MLKLYQDYGPLSAPDAVEGPCVDWSVNVGDIAHALRALSTRDRTGKALSQQEAFLQWRSATISLRQAGHTIYLVGNGASASMASHMAADLAKNAHVRTQVFTDLALMTAIANDISYEDVYAEPLARHIRPGDMLVAISSSGNSPNVVKACQVASDMDASVVTLSAMNSENRIRSMGQFNFWVPASTYGLAETCHAAILHFWMDSLPTLLH